MQVFQVPIDYHLHTLQRTGSVYDAKIRYAHPDGAQDPEEKSVREDRTKRMNPAYEPIQKARQSS